MLLQVGEEASSSINIKEWLKKKESKQRDGFAAQEAAARKAKLAVAKKKKEKNHYNQQPVRTHPPVLIYRHIFPLCCLSFEGNVVESYF